MLSSPDQSLTIVNLGDNHSLCAKSICEPNLNIPAMLQSGSGKFLILIANLTMDSRLSGHGELIVSEVTDKEKTMLSTDYANCLTVIHRYNSPLDTLITEVVSEIDGHIDWCSLNELTYNRVPAHCTLIIDYESYLHIHQTLSTILINPTGLDIVIYNAPISIRTETLLCLGRLRGLFYERTNRHTIAAGLRDIQQGKMVIPIDICHQLLDHYQTTHHYPVKTGTDLSQRESQVLRELTSGQSNLQIADRFCISECTVKSHLYNIYRKLDVKNRVQAMEWAKYHLNTIN